jgi:hypothetical protein
MHRGLGRAIVTAGLVLAVGHAAGSLPDAAVLPRHDRPDAGAHGRPFSTAPGDGSWRAVADPTGGCGAARLGETTVATLHNAPIVTLFANDRPVTLLLDTGAETTVLTPPPRGGSARSGLLSSFNGSCTASPAASRQARWSCAVSPWAVLRYHGDGFAWRRSTCRPYLPDPSTEPTPSAASTSIST